MSVPRVQTGEAGRGKSAAAKTPPAAARGAGVGVGVGVEESFEVVPVTGGRVGVRRWGRAVSQRGCAGEGAGGPALPLVLLHGFTGSSESWRTMATALAGGRDVIALDLPWHGATRLEAHDGERPAFEATADLLDAACEAIGLGRIALAGYSLGGRVALAWTLRRPHRIAALVLESASPGIAGDAERASRREADAELAAFAEREGVERFVDRWERTPVLATLKGLPPEVTHELRRLRTSHRAADLAASLRRHGAGSMPYLGGRLDEIAAPVLLVNGALDAKYDALARAMHACLPASRREVVARAGHTVHLERPDAFLAALDTFLREAEAAASRPTKEGEP